MELEELFVATARRLFETVPGSAAQRSANKWLVGFQSSADAWRVALQVLQRTTQQPQASEWRAPPTVLVVTMQLLRYKVSHDWAQISQEQRDVVRQTVVAWLTQGAGAAASAPAIRVACVIAADLVVKMHAESWPQWHQELQQLLNQSDQAEGLTKLLEIYGAIPAQLQASITDSSNVDQLTNEFQAHLVEIARVAQLALTSSITLESALRCIEHWCLGCVSSCPELGIDAALMTQASLLPTLLDLGLQGGNQTASDIVADVFMSSLSDTQSVSPAIVAAVVETTACLLSTLERLQIESSTNHERESHIARWQSLSQITSAIGMHHAAVILSHDGQAHFSRVATKSELSLPIAFLELALACTSFPDSDVAQPTLEFWFFLLDSSPNQGAQVQLLSNAVAPDQLVDILSRLVNALIQRCRYPQRIVDSQTLPSPTDDDTEVESITSLRKEVADTMLNLFSKWPATPAADRSVACVKGMASLLKLSSDIATLDAVLFLLEYTIELFDIDSSESEDDEADGTFTDNNLKSHSSNEGALLLQQILLDALKLPGHPLLLRGMARFYQSLSKSLVLPGIVYVQVSRKLSEGLELGASSTICAQVIRDISKSILQYTDQTERRDLLELMALKCQRVHSSNLVSGDLFEAALRLADGLSEQDFAAFCNAVLTPLMGNVSSPDARQAAESITLLGRACGGVQAPSLGVALAEQIWPLIAQAITMHGNNTKFRECTIQYFCSAIVKNPATNADRLRQVVEFCLQWLPNAVSPVTLQCLSAIVLNPVTHHTEFLPIAAQIVERTTLTITGSRLQFTPSSDDSVNRQHMDKLFANQDTTEQLAPEITEYLSLLRQIVRFFPLSLARGDLLTIVFRVSCLLLDVDHQVQEICDVVCDFILDASSSAELLNGSPTVPESIATASPHLLRAVLAFFGPKRTNYKQRSLWQFLFQLLHAPRVATPLKDHFQATLTALLVQEQVLSPLLSLEQAQSLAVSLVGTSHRHRFVTLLSQTAKQVEATPTV